MAAPLTNDRAPREHPRGTLILVLGILGLVFCQLLGPIAWLMGRSAQREIDASPDTYTNRGSVVAGRVLGLISTVLVGLAVLGMVAFGAFLYLTRDTSDPELKLADDPAATGEAVDAGTLDGTWTVVAGSGDAATVAGYRVEEVFAAGSRRATANGRTNDVTGSLTVAGGAVTEGTFTVDMTTLASDEGRRDNAIKGRGLETNRFPEATFVLTEPIELPELTDGKTFTVSATGELTLHGQTKPGTIEITGRSSGGTFTVQGSAPVAMADYGIEPPSVGGFVEVDDSGSFEFIVNFEKA